MKKLLTVLLALAMVASGFAAAPVASGDVFAISGEAGITFTADLENNVQTLDNFAKAKFEFVFSPETFKSTSGDGIWGELKIKVPELKFSQDTTATGLTNMTLSNASVEAALVHLMDGLTLGYINLGVGYGGDYHPGNVLSYQKGNFLSANGMGDFSGKGYTNGFVVQYDQDLFTVKANVNTANQDSTIKAAIGGSVTVKPMNDGLRIGAGFGYGINGTAEKDVKVFAGAEHTSLYIDDEDTYRLLPVVTYRYEKDNGAAVAANNELTAGVAFTWAPSQGNSVLKDVFGDWLVVEDGISLSGVSVSTKLNFNENGMDTVPVLVAFNLGPMVENLRVAAGFKEEFTKDADFTPVFGAAAEYTVKKDGVTILPKGGVMVEVVSKDEAKIFPKVMVDVKGLFDNIEFYAGWTDACFNTSDTGYASKGNMYIGTKIVM